MLVLNNNKIRLDLKETRQQANDRGKSEMLSLIQNLLSPPF